MEATFLLDPVKWATWYIVSSSWNFLNWNIRTPVSIICKLLFVVGNIVRQLDLGFLSFWRANSGGPKLKIFLLMLNDRGEKFIDEFPLRMWRFYVRRYFSKVWVVSYGRKVPKKRLELLSIIQETPVIAVKFLGNARNHLYFCTKNWQ